MKYSYIDFINDIKPKTEIVFVECTAEQRKKFIIKRFLLIFLIVIWLSFLTFSWLFIILFQNMWLLMFLIACILITIIFFVLNYNKIKEESFQKKEITRDIIYDDNKKYEIFIKKIGVSKFYEQIRLKKTINEIKKKIIINNIGQSTRYSYKINIYSKDGQTYKYKQVVRKNSNAITNFSCLKEDISFFIKDTLTFVNDEMISKFLDELLHDFVKNEYQIIDDYNSILYNEMKNSIRFIPKQRNFAKNYFHYRETHCWKCGCELNSKKNSECSLCGWIRCPKCGSCDPSCKQK